MGEPLNPDDFHRNEIIACITEGSKVVGFHLYSAFDLRSEAHCDHHYLKAYGEDTLKKFKSFGINTLMSMEYLTVLPEYRSRSSHVSWSEVIIALGSLVMENSPWDCLVGTGRKDLNVRRKSGKSGAQYFGTVLKMNYECEILMTQKGHVTPLEDPKMVQLVDGLWNKKNCYTKIISENENFVAKAA